MRLFDTAVTVVNYGTTGTDKLGKPIRGVLRRRPNVRARLTMQQSEEGETYTADRYRGMLSPETPVSAKDELVHRGRTFRVEGSPELQDSGLRSLRHIAVVLKLISEA